MALIPQINSSINYQNHSKEDYHNFIKRCSNFSTLRVDDGPSKQMIKHCNYAKTNANLKSSVETFNTRKVNGICVEKNANSLVKDGSRNISNENLNYEYLLGKFAEDKFVFRQSFVIRSYEIGPDKTATMETIMNLLQETALNHVANSGVAGEGFGATREMSLRKLIWVVTRIQVEIEKYSSWGDVVEIDTWVDAAGKNGMRRDWIIRDYNTQNIITRATSTWVTMNRETRRLSKIPDAVKEELQQFYLNRASIAAQDIDRESIEKLNDHTTDRMRTGLAPRWSDMDVNQHVNNVKYIGWILESVPMKVLEEYNMTSMTLEYRRECHQSNVLESLTSMNVDNKSDQSNEDFKCTHLLRMEEDHAEIVRARSIWKCKH